MSRSISTGTGGVVADVTAMERALAMLDNRETISIRVDIDTTRAYTDLIALRAAILSLSQSAADIDVDIDTGGIVAELAAIRTTLAGIAEDIKIQVELVGGAAAIGQLAAVRARRSGRVERESQRRGRRGHKPGSLLHVHSP